MIFRPGHSLCGRDFFRPPARLPRSALQHAGDTARFCGARCGGLCSACSTSPPRPCASSTCACDGDQLHGPPGATGAQASVLRQTESSCAVASATDRPQGPAAVGKTRSISRCQPAASVAKPAAHAVEVWGVLTGTMTSRQRGGAVPIDSSFQTINESMGYLTWTLGNRMHDKLP